MVLLFVVSYKCFKIKWVNRFYLFVDGDDCWYLLFIEKYFLDGVKKIDNWKLNVLGMLN